MTSESDGDSEPVSTRLDSPISLREVDLVFSIGYLLGRVGDRHRIMNYINAFERILAFNQELPNLAEVSWDAKQLDRVQL